MGGRIAGKSMLRFCNGVDCGLMSGTYWCDGSSAPPGLVGGDVLPTGLRPWLLTFAPSGLLWAQTEQLTTTTNNLWLMAYGL
jgi:hypothetical protein